LAWSMALMTIYWTPSIPPRPSTTPQRTGRSQSWRLDAWIRRILLNSSACVALSTRLHPLRPPDARPAPARGIRDALDRPAVVRPRHCGPGGRSPAKTRWCLARRRFDTFSRPIGFPTSTATLSQRPRPSSVVDVSMGSDGKPVASSLSAEDTSFVHRTVVVVGSSLVSYLGCRASSAAVGARRALKAARVHALVSPDPPSIRDGEETSSIAIVSRQVGSSAHRRIKKKSKKLIVEWQCRGTRPSRWIRRLIWRKMAMDWLLDST